MLMQEWHIWDFPDSIYVKLDDGYRLKLFKRLHEFYGSHRKMAKALGRDLSIVTTLRRGVDYGGYEAYIPMSILKKIIATFPEQKHEIEKAVIAYRCRAGWPVHRPILPIRESPQLYNILVHMLCDGSAGKGKTPYYANTCKELREELKMNLKIFGDVETKEYIMHHDVWAVMFPKAVTDVLKHIFKVRMVYSNRLPEVLLESSNDCKRAAVRAFFDDEGCVSGKMVCLTFSSKYALQQIKEILEQLDVMTGVIYNVAGNCYGIQILVAGKEMFLQRVGFTHPNKLSRLSAIVNDIKQKAC